MFNPSGGPGGPGGPGVNPMAGGPGQPGTTGPGGPSVRAAGVPPNVGGSYPQGTQPPTSWYQGGQQPMTATGPQQTPLYSNTPYGPRMPYMTQGAAPSKSGLMWRGTALINAYEFECQYFGLNQLLI